MLIYALISAIIISSISLVGILLLRYKNISLYLVSLAAGALLGDVFLHLIPEMKINSGASLLILLGFLIFFIIEKIIHWRHCQTENHGPHRHQPLATMNLIGDGLHNFLDGLIIAASFITSLPLGLASSIAIMFHEIPQEIGDFGVLLHAGLSRKKALLLNLASASLAILGVLMAFIINSDLIELLIPLAVGGFIYIAGVDLVPELHQEKQIKKSAIQIAIFSLGVLLMLALKIYGA